MVKTVGWLCSMLDVRMLSENLINLRHRCVMPCSSHEQLQTWWWRYGHLGKEEFACSIKELTIWASSHFSVPNICESAKPAQPLDYPQAWAASGLNHEGQSGNKAQTWDGPCFLPRKRSTFLSYRICLWMLGGRTWDVGPIWIPLIRNYETRVSRRGQTRTGRCGGVRGQLELAS